MIYHIKQGQHRSRSLIRASLTCKDSIEFEFKFDRSAVYRFDNIEDQYRINKLYGFSDSWSHHSRHSARLGWRYIPSKDEIEILLYCHVLGEEKSTLIRTIDFDILYKGRIVITDKHYFGFVVDNYPVNYIINSRAVIKRNLNINPVGLKYRLYPYFGGRNPATHDMIFYVKEINK